MKFKGEVPIRMVRAVETVDKTTFNRGAMFQVGNGGGLASQLEAHRH